MIMTADEAIIDVVEHAYLQGVGAESAELRERREVAGAVIRRAFAIMAEVEKCFEPTAENWKLQPADAWARTVMERVNANIKRGSVGITADEAINNIARHAYIQGADIEIECVQLRERREAAEAVIRRAFAIMAEVEACLNTVENWRLLPADTWARTVLERVNAKAGGAG